MPKRFSRYDFALKAVDGAPPASSPAGKYQAYKKGETKPTYTRDPDSRPGEMVQATLIPFGTLENTEYAIQYSSRAQSKMSVVGITDSLLQITSNATPAAGTLTNPGFVPARVTVLKRGETSTPEPSQITGVSYQKVAGSASYTYPFGRKGDSGATAVYQGVAQAIKNAVDAVTTPTSCSFKPEIFRLS